MNCACNVNQAGRPKAITAAVALGLLVAPVVGAVLYLRSGGECSACHEAAVLPNPRLPADVDWSRAAASKLDGGHFAMAELVGKPVVLYFWATWCPQCRVQRNVLNELAGEWSDRLRIVALSVDDDASAVSRYLEGHPRLSDELLASPELLAQFHVEALPTLAAIDAIGRVRTVSAGPMDAGELRNVVEPLLK